MNHLFQEIIHMLKFKNRLSILNSAYFILPPLKFLMHTVICFLLSGIKP